MSQTKASYGILDGKPTDALNEGNTGWRRP
jgi:hypothetical protein